MVEEGRGRKGAVEVERAGEEGWIEVVAPSNESLLRLLLQDLSGGEAEVVALAVEGRGSEVLLDECGGRRAAETFGLHKTGVIGILLRARLDGTIPSLREALDCLREDSGFWISDHVYEGVLKEVGENVA